MRDIVILWKLLQSDVHGDPQCLIVVVVGNQPLQRSLDNSSSHMKVTVGLVGPLLPYYNDVKVKEVIGQRMPDPEVG